MKVSAVPLVAFICGIGLLLSACGGSGDESASRTPHPAPEVVLTAEEKQVWAPLPPDRSSVPVLLYHGIGSESEFSDPADASYGIDFADFARQMTLIKHAGYQTIDLPTFLRFVTGEPVDLPPRPLLLTFDDARADSWTGSDGILEKLGFNAVMFVDVGRVDDGDPEYLTWQELETLQSSGRWQLETPLRPRATSRSSTAPARTTTAPTTPTRSRTRRSSDGRSACAPTSTGAKTHSPTISRIPAARVRSPVWQLRAGRHERPAHPRRPARLADRRATTRSSHRTGTHAPTKAANSRSAASRSRAP